MAKALRQIAGRGYDVKVKTKVEVVNMPSPARYAIRSEIGMKLPPQTNLCVNPAIFVKYPPMNVLIVIDLKLRPDNQSFRLGCTTSQLLEC